MPAKRKGYILVEGKGEVEAAQTLIARLSFDLEFYLPWSHPLRWVNLHQWDSQRRGGVRNGAEFIRSKADAGALLILRDCDDECPKQLAPEIAHRLAGLCLPFPVSYVLLRPEYEVLFLPCLGSMAGAGFPEGTSWDKPTWEARRGIKEWLSQQLPLGRAYKPSVSQLPMTRLINFDILRAANVPCFGSLERGIRFLSSQVGQVGAVYPLRSD